MLPSWMTLRTMIHLLSLLRSRCRVFSHMLQRPHWPLSRASVRRSLLGALSVGLVPRLWTPGVSLHVVRVGGSARHAQHHLAQVSWHRDGASASTATKCQRQCSRQDVADCRHVGPEVLRQRQCRQCEAVLCRREAACVPRHCGDISRRSLLSAAKAAQRLRRRLLTVPADRQGGLCLPSMCSLVAMLPVWETRRWKHQGANARAELEAAAQRFQRAIDGARLPALRRRLGIDGIVAQMSVQLAKAAMQQRQRGVVVSPRYPLAAAVKFRWLLHRKGKGVQPHRVMAMRTRMQKAEREAAQFPHKQTSWNSAPQRFQMPGGARKSSSPRKLEQRGLPPPSENAWMKL